MLNDWCYAWYTVHAWFTVWTLFVNSFRSTRESILTATICTDALNAGLAETHKETVTDFEMD